MAYKPLWDWMDKQEGRKEGSSTDALNKEKKRQGIAQKMKPSKKVESKSYTHSRCGSCNRFGHTHDKCATATRRTIPKSVTRHMQPNEKKSYEEGMKNTEYGRKYL